MDPDTTKPGRDGRGRFTAGAKPGPGRPATKKATSPPSKTKAPSLDGNELFFRAMQARDTDDAWHAIVEMFTPPVVYAVALEAAERDEQLPQFLVDFLIAHNLWSKPSAPTKDAPSRD